MSGYALHPEAYIDIDEIREYIAADNPDAADRMVTEIFDAIRSLVHAPHQGFRRPNLTSRAVRFKLVREYLSVLIRLGENDHRATTL
jgi:plasmid stabilization system protein ParE